MSYCRFTEGDVYAYEGKGGVRFWTLDDDHNRLCSTYNEAYEYAKSLREDGIDLPDHAIAALREDAIAEAERICGPRGVVAELVTENKRLRKVACAAWKCAHTGLSCSDCRLIAGGCTLQSAMLELGIEVGE